MTQTIEKLKEIEIKTGFFERSRINANKLFVLEFGGIPNEISMCNLKCNKVERWLNEFYKEGIQLIHTSSTTNIWGKERKDFSIYKLEIGAIISIEYNCGDIILFYNKDLEDFVEEIFNGLRKFLRRIKKVPSINLIVNTVHGIGTTKIQINKPKLSLADNYNDDIIPLHKIIYEKLSTKDGNGLVILHGKPGTGKTSYIRFLVSKLKKEVIFLPPNLATVITTPDFMSFLMKMRNSVLVIEDAENIIMSREAGGSSTVSSLLNISDGLLSDCLKLQIICSFNTDISKIDNALQRKGRLIAKYEFKDLTAEKATSLSKKLGLESTFISPVSLTSIYNQEETHVEEIKDRKPIGFKALSCN